jgi:diguanylate cyclase (GGDEF)-like protein/PAS domain S-box-containing protein
MPPKKEHDIVDELSKLLLDIMMLGNPPHVPARFASVDSLQTLYANLISLRDFLYATSNGDLSREVSFKGYLGGTLKTLQANLRHITWQTKMVASGDFTQRVEFMGEFSQSFNAMVIQLDQTLNELVRKDDKLRFEEQRFRALVEHSSDMIVLVNPEGVITYVNPAIESVLGFKPEERIGAKGIETVHPDDINALADSFNTLTRDTNSPVVNAELRLRHKDGSWRTLEAVGSNMVNNNVVESIILNYRDITERKKAEEALKQSEVFLNTLINSIPIPVFYKNRDGQYVGFNKAFETFFGATKEQLIGKTVFDINTPELARIYHAKDNELFESGGEQYYESQVKNTFGVTRDVIFSKAALTDSKGNVSGLIGAIYDISDRKKAEEQIQYLATHDLLTDLPSLRFAKDRMSVALNMARRYKKAVAVMFIDLDGFKDVNDTLGHDAGDYVLKQVATRMLSCVRETDTVARVGGDEFLIIATEINDPENAAQIAEKVIHLVSQPIIFNGRQAVVSVSIGIALFPDDSIDMDQLIKKADEAMYRVKKAGKNGFRFTNDTVN